MYSDRPLLNESLGTIACVPGGSNYTIVAESEYLFHVCSYYFFVSSAFYNYLPSGTDVDVALIYLRLPASDGVVLAGLATTFTDLLV